MAIPQILHRMHPLYQGISIHLNSDEAIYLARVQESLTGRPELAAEAFTGHPGLLGSQVAFIESWYGRMFAFTGWNAATLFDVFDVVVPILIFLSLVTLFRIAGLSKNVALVTVCVFSLVQLYSLGRPIHMRSSFLLMLWALIPICFALRPRTADAKPLFAQCIGITVGGAVLGTLVGVYFWSFTFAWAFWGVYALWEFLEWAYEKWTEHQQKPSRMQKVLHTAWGMFWHLRPRKPSFQFLPWHVLCFVGIVGLLAALPAIAHMLTMSMHPLYEYAVFRSGMHPGRLPESLVYSFLFIAMSVSALAALLHDYEKLRPYRPLLVLVFASLIYMHQNVVHNITFNFVSHGIFSLLISALGIIALSVSVRSRQLTLGCLGACVYIAAIAYDGRFVLKQWTVTDEKFADQHLSESIEVLKDIPRGRILSDPQTSSVIAGYTHHDVAYSVYLKNVLMTHSELASRYCLTQIPVPPGDRNIARTHHLIFPDASSAFGAEVRAEEVRLVENACRELDLDPAISLKTFEIDYVLWNRKSAPMWDMKRIPIMLDTVASGEDWILLKVVL